MAGVLGRLVLEQHGMAIMLHLLSDGLWDQAKTSGLRIEDLIDIPHPIPDGPLPSVTVAVCTRNRAASLKRCADSLNCLDYPDLEIFAVDNAPNDDSTERLIRHNYPNIRYVVEPRPGLNWARNRAVLEGRGDVIAFTDDDTVVDPGWVTALARVFIEDPRVMAVTGLVVPYELETEAQILFEKLGGFGRGFERKYYHEGLTGSKQIGKLYGGSGRMGTGANMAYRRSVFDRIGLFDPTLDVGTPTGGGGDLEMFFRVVKEGYMLVYEPNALVRHAHRRDYPQLRTQMTGWGTGFYAHLMRSAMAYPHEAVGLFRLGSQWLWERNIRRFLLSFIHSSPSTRDIIWAELWGSLIGVFRYFKARSIAARIEGKFGSQPHLSEAMNQDFPHAQSHRKSGVAVRSLDLSAGLDAIADVADYSSTRLFVTQNGRVLGPVNMTNHYGPISGTRLRDAIVKTFGLRLLGTEDTASPDFMKAEVLEGLRRHYINQDGPPATERAGSLPSSVSVSVVVATYDRPDQLRNCLRCLTTQKTPRFVEILVVDNHPDSQLTPPVVAEFPGVLLVKEARQGLSYARNAGIIATSGEIIVSTDDDVAMPADWLEKLAGPFVREDVMVVTGNVLPLELETAAQGLFETYGGLGRGFERLEVDGSWFRSFGRRAVPTWRLGSAANAAFRATIFGDPKIGLLDEALGTGTPTGCSEDTYLFYKVLRAGYTLVYEPRAYVWHKHRRDMKSFRHQIYSYSKGHAAYHLTTLIQGHDLRAFFRLMWELPRWHLRQIKESLWGSRDYPLSLIMTEIIGNIVGPFALWRSRWRVKRKGRSKPYKSPAQRSSN